MFKKMSLDVVRKSGNLTFYTIISLILLCPSFAVEVRRFHDMNLSGWWALLLEICIGILMYFLKEDYFVIFLISVVYLLLLSLIPGSKGKNKYGEKD